MFLLRACFHPSIHPSILPSILPSIHPSIHPGGRTDGEATPGGWPRCKAGLARPDALDLDSTRKRIPVGRRTTATAPAAADADAGVAIPVAETEKKMVDARCLFCFAATLVTYGLFSSASEVRLRRGTTWKVTTIQDFPYAKSKGESPTKKEDWEGYIPDLLQKIGEQLHQSYTITAVADQKYGIKDPTTNIWNGMIGEIVDKRADVAASAITITDARREAVDFTDPLMTIGAIILLKKPSDGSAIKIKSAADLADQWEVSYGVVRDGTTIQLINNSTLPYFQKMSRALNADPDRLLITSNAGVHRVRKENGKFAFITESATGEYWANQKPCDLISVPIDLPAREYAFAVAKGSTITARLNDALEKLRESGEMEKIRKKWWKEQCSSAASHPWGVLLILAPLALFQFVTQSARFK